jgi:acyl-coenzyme A synthetase/AMP-(fatty) acid ligase
MIRRAGENISAAEVESVLAASSFVRQVAVVGTHDPIREEEVIAFIVPSDEVQCSSESAERIFNHCAERLAPFKLPAWVAFVEALPLTGTNKIQKHALLGPDKKPLPDLKTIDLRRHKANAIKTNGSNNK